MRIDTQTFYNASISGITNNQASIALLTEQISTNQKLLAPKDDPVAMSQILDLTNRVDTRTQFAANQVKADTTQQYEQVLLGQIRNTLNQAKNLLAGTSPNDQLGRGIHAEQLQGLFNQLLSLANSRDASGQYIFAGDKTNSAIAPFINSGGGDKTTTPYSGVATSYVNNVVVGGVLQDNTTVRSVIVDTGRTLQVTDNINSVLQAGQGVSKDVLQALDEAISRLPLSGTPNDVTQADLTGYMNTINQALNNLSTIDYRVAGAQSELANVKSSNQALMTNDQNVLSGLTQVDQAKAIVELQARQTTLTAAMQSFSLTSKLSLFNYL